jgi:ribokinase
MESMTMNASENDVVCIGSAAMDTVVVVEEFPSSDQISLAQWSKEFCGGSSANVSVGLSRLGLYSGLVSNVGRDQYGVTLLSKLISEGVDIRAVRVSGKTARTIILVGKGGEKAVIADTDCALKRADELPADYVARTKALYIGECFLPVAEKAMDLVRNKEILSFLRIKNVHYSAQLDLEPIISRADFVIMNEKTYVLSEEKRENFIVTKGVNGCYYAREDLDVEGFAVDTVDTTGAGDAFSAGLIYQIVKGHSLKDALVFANAAGAVSTMTYGAMESMPSKEKVESFLQHGNRY